MNTVAGRTMPIRMLGLFLIGALSMAFLFALLVAGDVPSVEAQTTGDCSTGIAVTGNGTVSGSWSSDCDSEGRSGSYASYYTLTLAESADVTIMTESSVDTYLFLREGAGRDGTVLYENDDIVSGNTNSRISESLSAGTYTIEVSTYTAGQTGDFTLTISGLPTAATRPRRRNLHLRQRQSQRTSA